MLTCKRTRQVEMSRSSRIQDRDSGAAAHDGEQAEDRQNQCHGTRSTNQVSGPNARLFPQRASDWDVDEERVELSVGPGCVQRLKPFFKLIRTEPALNRRVP